MVLRRAARFPMFLRAGSLILTCPRPDALRSDPNAGNLPRDLPRTRDIPLPAVTMLTAISRTRSLIKMATVLSCFFVGLLLSGCDATFAVRGTIVKRIGPPERPESFRPYSGTCSAVLTTTWRRCILPDRENVVIWRGKVKVVGGRFMIEGMTGGESGTQAQVSLSCPGFPAQKYEVLTRSDTPVFLEFPPADPENYVLPAFDNERQ